MKYYCNASTPPVREAIAAGNIGQIVSPADHNAPVPGADWCADNGAYSGKYPGDGPYIEWLDRLAGRFGTTPEFAVAPDIPGDAAATITRSLPVIPAIRDLGFPAAFAAQNGLEHLTVPWDDFDVLFIGGDTQWKLGAAAAKLAGQARDNGKNVHMGRVNTLRRLRHAAHIGCTSADGTYITFGPDLNLSRMTRWVTQVNAQPSLFPPGGGLT